MGELAVGDIVTVAFPFSNLTDTKKRPALVAARTDLGDIVLCQITSREYSSRSAIPLVASDFATGGLPVKSFVRPAKLFTASESIVIDRLGTLRASPLRSIRAAISAVFSD